MKFTFIFLFVYSVSNAQVAIGKSSVEGSGLLDFKENVGGIALPKVITFDSTPVPGTLIYNTANGAVEYKDNTSWKKLSRESGPFDVSLNSYSSYTETVDSGTIFGDYSTSTAPGSLVLASSDKALILPKVSKPHLSIVNPEPGLICFDTDSKKICVFNGISWFFWGIE